MRCPVCGAELGSIFTKSQRSNRQAVMLMCPVDARHFRGFVNDPKWVSEAVACGDPELLLKERRG